MSGLTIRAARDADLPQITQLGQSVNRVHHAYWPQLFSDAQDFALQHRYWQQCLNAPRALCLVAEMDGIFAGMLIAQIVAEAGNALLQPRHLCRVATVAVDTPMRRRGVATALMRTALRQATAAGVQELRLNVWDFNDAAIALYRKLGLVTRLHTLAIELPLTHSPEK